MISPHLDCPHDTIIVIVNFLVCAYSLKLVYAPYVEGYTYSKLIGLWTTSPLSITLSHPRNCAARRPCWLIFVLEIDIMMDIGGLPTDPVTAALGVLTNIPIG